MNKHSAAFQEAINIAFTRPLPADAKQRLVKLEKQVRSDERDNFGDLWSAFIMEDIDTTMKHLNSSEKR